MLQRDKSNIPYLPYNLLKHAVFHEKMQFQVAEEYKNNLSYYYIYNKPDDNQSRKISDTRNFRRDELQFYRTIIYISNSYCIV